MVDNLLCSNDENLFVCLVFAAKGWSQLEELNHLADVIQSCSEEPFKVGAPIELHCRTYIIWTVRQIMRFHFLLSDSEHIMS